jgi:hypothetical protein
VVTYPRRERAVSERIPIYHPSLTLAPWHEMTSHDIAWPRFFGSNVTFARLSWNAAAWIPEVQPSFVGLVAGFGGKPVAVLVVDLIWCYTCLTLIPIREKEKTSVRAQGR